jgi:predicted dehydrogenase/threonine dehydrogenase-like Zn-dependent dehydrogenase
MRQLVQSVRDGDLRLVDLPDPVIDPTQVLVATRRSLVSPGTERAVRRLAQASLLAKARARPDLVRQVVRKARTEGVGATRRAVSRRLGEDMALGYSATGIAVAVGEAVRGVEPGQRVATGGAGHGDLQVVAGLLAVPVPETVDDDDAAFATVGAIALHGLRLAAVGPADRVLVVGLGLVGQLAARLARAAGCLVTAVDLRPELLEPGRRAGIDVVAEQGEITSAALLETTRGQGFDAVLVCAASASDAPVQRAVAAARDRATIVVVGDVGLDLDRRPLYDKELSVRVARSYGPGRYETAYEDLGIDYPAGQVRWTEGRNLGAVLDLLADGRLRVDDLVTHRFAFGDALGAYQLLESGELHLGVLLEYADTDPRGLTTVRVHRAPTETAAPSAGAGPTEPGVGLIGAGGFMAGTLVPALGAAGLGRVVSVTSASGRTARRLAEETGIARVVTDAEAVIADPAVDAVVIATPHDRHATQVVEALTAGRHVFCEKPLALSFDELDTVEAAWRSAGTSLLVGFNRRHAPLVARALDHLGPGPGPLTMTYRVNAGPVPAGHWYADRRQGGRLLGEVCHFVDLCCALAGSPPSWVQARGSGADELLLASDLVVTVGFADGSLAAITYASGGHPATPKERLEILGRGRTVVIDDFRSLTLDDRTTRSAQDKGHRALIARFRRAIASGGDPAATEAALVSTAATLAAARSLSIGAAVTLQRPPEPEPTAVDRRP